MALFYMPLQGPFSFSDLKQTDAVNLNSRSPKSLLFDGPFNNKNTTQSTFTQCEYKHAQIICTHID